MAKVELMTTTKQEQPKYFKDMEVGDLAVITEGIYVGEYVMRSEDTVVCLNDGDTWSGSQSAGQVEVRILERGEQIVLTQE